jgi:hypothetical protein
MRIKLFFLLICLFSTISVFSQSHSNEIGFQTDDDSYLFQGSDRYYTDGTFFYYRQALKVKTNDSTSLRNKVLGFEIGQKLFTPQSGSIANSNGVDQVSLIDRPFAAYLYVGSTLNLLFKNESNLKIGAQLGVVGPDALGRPAQDFIHDNFGFYHPSGWEYQVDNNFELNLSAEYNKLIARAAWIDISASGYINLGNGFTGAGVGPLLRLGNFNQLFHSVSTQSTAIKNDDTKPLHQQELFFYYKPLFNYVAYDATIQGGLFNNHNNSQEITLDKEPFVFSQEFGLAFTSKRFVLIAAVISQTKNVKEMLLPEAWGSFTVLYRFK